MSAGVNHSTSGSSFTVTVIVAFIRLVTFLQAFAVMPVARGLFCVRSNCCAEAELRNKAKSEVLTPKQELLMHYDGEARHVCLIALLFTCALKKLMLPNAHSYITEFWF